MPFRVRGSAMKKSCAECSSDDIYQNNPHGLCKACYFTKDIVSKYRDAKKKEAEFKDVPAEEEATPIVPISAHDFVGQGQNLDQVNIGTGTGGTGCDPVTEDPVPEGNDLCWDKSLRATHDELDRAVATDKPVRVNDDDTIYQAEMAL